MAADIEMPDLAKKLSEWRAALPGKFRAALEKIKPRIILNIRGNFNSSATASGRDWKKRREIGDGHPLLMDTGTLLQAAVGGGAGHISEITADTLDTGVSFDRVPYSRVHQYGYPPKNIPQREYLAISRETTDELAEIAADELLGVFFD